MWAAVYMLFAFSLLIHGVIMPGPHILNTYYDELLYWGVAKTFWTQPAFTVYHVPVDFSKFFYSLVLSPLYLIRNAAARTTLAGWVNTAMICASVFPAYRLSRKLTSSKAIQLAGLVLFMCSPVMNYGEKYVPECLYLPLSLYLMLGYYNLYQRIVEPEYSLRRLCMMALLLGLLAYVSYITKEAVLALIGAFLAWTLIVAIKALRRKDNVWKRYLIAIGVHVGAVAICYIVVKLIVGMVFSYSDQVGLDIIGSMYRIEFLIRCIISNGLYTCVAMFGLPVMYWQIKKNRQSKLSDNGVVQSNWIMFFFIAFALTLFFISYSISMTEDFGKSSIRLHTRYYIPFIFPFFVLVFDEIRQTPNKVQKASVAAVLIVGIAGVLLLTPNRYVSTYDSFDTWHIKEPGNYFDDITEEAEDEELAEGSLATFFADQTDGSREVYYNHGVLIALAVYAVITTLMVWLIYKKKDLALLVFFCAILIVELYNNTVTVDRVGRFITVTDAETEAYSQLDHDVREIVGDDNLLVISNDKLEDNKRTIEAFFSFDWYSALTNGINRVIDSDGIINLNETGIPLSMTQFTSVKYYPVGTTFDYVLCLDDVQFNENCVEQVLYSEETGYHLYKLVDPAYMDIDYIADYYEE